MFDLLCLRRQRERLGCAHRALLYGKRCRCAGDGCVLVAVPTELSKLSVPHVPENELSPASLEASQLV